MTSSAKRENATKLNRKENTALLGTFELTGSASRNILIGNVKQMYEKGAIRALGQEEGLIKLIQDNKLGQFDARVGRLEKSQNAKVAKRKAEELAEEPNHSIHQKETPKYIMKVKHRNSELPTFEVRFKKEHSTFEAAWKDGVAKLVSLAAEK